MAQSKAKKRRMRSIREGGIDPQMNRLTWGSVVPVERKTPTWTESKDKLHHKHKRKWNRELHHSDGSIFCLCGGGRPQAV
ncbi:hypothetical protein N0M98_18885 [Paenibacillus doosanensis]|uniref:Uncharacterized protein n=1 Tax=Paenibacillus konkukensis TaxID=2020716 RepID=A0ABY4RLB4_9BACL|nr:MULTISPECIES: hypothetical protein [Paenibacillus]MCS7462209.1 hypothetical protein [Paenibacillus doosanensis]UQZ82928.1 hypothetical protein SK3146_02088 [Paenibacillus konkukensis]